MKNFNRVAIVAALATAGLLGTTLEAKAQSETYTQQKLVFSCELRNNSLATVPQLIQETENARSPFLPPTQQVLQEFQPVLVWATTLSSSNPVGAYTPEARCNSVSTRLTNLAASLGVTSLQEMTEAGMVITEDAILIENDASTASERVVFTLSPSNRANPDQVLEQFQVGVSAGVGGSQRIQGASSPIVE
ncbi:MAG: hypothetical protein F6K19_23735 [Cyanothece sp. SIO1E1]|nr:hypothetical protein [Cyanothece sp. SIO1E1]